MKIITSAVILAAVTLLSGCSSHHNGAAAGHEELFRQQIAESLPVKDWGYKVQDIRFSDDYRKALVVFVTPEMIQKDVVLDDDGFRRYSAGVIDLARQQAARSADVPAWSTGITVTLPDTATSYRHDQEFRQQVEASIPIQKWGYKTKEIRFTDDYKKALVVFDADSKHSEVVLEDDGFHRFLGKAVRALDSSRLALSTNISDWCVFITVTLPDR